jgi:hypothetical protein
MIDQNWIYLGVILNLIGSVTYVVHTLQGKAKPNRVTWFLWALAPLLAYGAMLSKGVSPVDGLMTFMVGFGPLMVLIASFVSKKSAWKITQFDITCGFFSLVGILLWLVTQDAFFAIVFTIVADGLALLPTLVKSWKEPESESYLVFLNGAISAGITLLAIKTYDFSHVAFPLYIFIACGLLFVVIKFKLGRRLSKTESLESPVR